MMSPTLSASLEDYLEVILHVVEAKGAARPKDIVEALKIGASSVTAALKSLAAKDLVNYAPYDVITLTESGEKIARDVAHRHETLRKFFIQVLAADQKLADGAACQMEHAVPNELVNRFVRFLEFVKMCPRVGPALLGGFRAHLAAGCHPDCFDDCPMSGMGRDKGHAPR
jgi:DtxR family Mn-dependent transcriptional regulator